MASNAENVSIWWRHHDQIYLYVTDIEMGNIYFVGAILLTKRKPKSLYHVRYHGASASANSWNLGEMRII